jgi:hypothetical protein
LATVATGFLKGIQIMSEEICGNCKYYLPCDEDEGVCRRYPPAIVEYGEESVFPDTNIDIWCGEWKPEENKEGASS